ncbi:nucleoporin complex subunit 54-domain-containing protein, partial [Crucibulum laeve]
HNFYNLVDPNQVSLYGRPPNATNNELWEKAVRENPDPKCLVPVIAIGFDDIRERVEAQSKQAEQHQQRLKDLKSRVEDLNTRHSVSNSSRLLRAAAQQTQVTQRLMAFIQHLHLLIPAIRSSSIRPEEEELRGKLEELEDEIRRGRMKGKLNELWALLGAVNASKERSRTAAGEWAVVDEDGLAQLAQILSDQQAGLAHLTKILQQALKDVARITGKNGSISGEELHANEGDMLWSSTATLRASALR